MAPSPNHRNWGDLPTELLGLFLDNLLLLPDYIHFGAVCKRWRSTARGKYQDRLDTCHQQPPMLLLPPANCHEDHRDIYSMWDGKTYSHLFTKPNTNIYQRCLGSSYGWLVVQDWYTKLLNPFSGKTIGFPTITYNPKVTSFSCEKHLTVRTVMLSCDPCLNPNDWVAVAIFSEDYGYGANSSRLACTRPGYSWWYHTDHSLEGGMLEAGFYEGQLYVMNYRYEIFRIPVQDETCWRKTTDYGLFLINHKVVKKLTKSSITLTRSITYPSKFYFVELEGDLLLIQRRYSSVADHRQPTVGFDVYKLWFKEEEQSSEFDYEDLVECTEMEDLGGHSLFLGDNKLICISPSTFPECQPNCIYYTADNKQYNTIGKYGKHMVDDMGVFAWRNMVDDIGVFDLATGRIRHFHTVLPSELYTETALWISPRLG